MSFVEIKNLTKRYGSMTAVDGISFTIEEGELFSLLGPNGAGKSTCIGMLAMLTEPSAGDATIGGLSVRGRSRELRRGCGLVPQEIALHEELSGRDNLLFWGRLYGLAGRALRRRVDELLQRIGLSEKASKPVKSYSGGMKRRINLAAGLIHKPRLLFMDEPTVGIDPHSRRAVLDLIGELKREGTTILYTTNAMAEAEELSDRVGIVDHGRLMAVGTCAELASSIGGNQLLRLTFTEESAGARLADLLNRLPGARLETEGASLSVLAPRVRELLPRVIEAASSAGAVLQGVEIREPDLETVFLTYTGHELRD